MPYIKERREIFDGFLNRLRNEIHTDGELTYCIYKLCLMKIADKGISYDTFKSIIGTLECTKHEIQRRHLDKYEDIKISENSDVLI